MDLSPPIPRHTLWASAAGPTSGLTHQVGTYRRLFVILADPRNESRAVSEVCVEGDFVDDGCRLGLYGGLLVRQRQALQAAHVRKGVLQSRHFWLRARLDVAELCGGYTEGFDSNW